MGGIQTEVPEGPETPVVEQAGPTLLKEEHKGEIARIINNIRTLAEGVEKATSYEEVLAAFRAANLDSATIVDTGFHQTLAAVEETQEEQPEVVTAPVEGAPTTIPGEGEE